jgi:glutathione peroxidase
MKYIKTLSMVIGAAAFSAQPLQAAPAKTCPTVLNHTLKTLDGQSQNLCAYQGKVVLMVNTASMCGYTPQYKGLQALHTKYKDKGLVVLGFPAANFGGQELASDKEIAKFCKDNYSVTFPVFSKSSVKGSDRNPVYQILEARTGEAPLWNFHKYLIARDGQKVLSFSSGTNPMSPKFTQAIEQLLAQK